MGLTCNTTVFHSNLRRYAVIAGKSIMDAVLEESRLIAQKLVTVTPPKTSGKGKKKIADDISRVYLSSTWFLETFAFSNKKLDDRVKEAVRANNESTLTPIFEHSPKLKRIHIEAYNVDTLARFRKNGTVPKGVAPYSYPLSEQGKIRSLIKQKQKASALVKSGWATCVKKLGGTVAGWLGKTDNGNVIINKEDSSVTLINSVSYAANLDARGNFSRMVLNGRDRAMATKIDITLKKLLW